MENFMEPNSRLIPDVRMLPRIPRVVSLRLSSNETPIDRPDLIFLGNRQHRIERAAGPPCHVLRAEHGTIKPLQEEHFALETFRPSIVVKGDHVGIVELDLLDLRP